MAESAGEIIHPFDEVELTKIDADLSRLNEISERFLELPAVQQLTEWMRVGEGNLLNEDDVTRRLFDALSIYHRLMQIAYWLDVNCNDYMKEYQVTEEEMVEVPVIMRRLASHLRYYVGSASDARDKSAGRLPGDHKTLHETLPAKAIRNVGQAQAFMSDVIRKQAELYDDGPLGELEIQFLDGSPTETGAYIKFAILEDVELPVEQASYDPIGLKLTIKMRSNPFKLETDVS